MSGLAEALAELAKGIGLITVALLGYRILLHLQIATPDIPTKLLDRILIGCAAFLVVATMFYAIYYEPPSTAWMYTPVKPNAFPVQ